jgi:hypothetical protein
MKPLPFFFLICLLSSCANHGQLTFITKLPGKLKENSGIVSYQDSTAWFIEDNGNSDNIYKTDFNGKFIQQFDVKNGKNGDWEDLTKDKQGHLYIGDFGNNDNDRKDLLIYKLPNPEMEKGEKIGVERVKFSYPEQTDFPPKKAERVFDAEAFLHASDHLYIFTKNRTKPFSGETWIYKVPDSKGTYEAKLVGKIFLGDDWDTCQVTSADISADGKTIVLLTYGKLWVLSDFTLDRLSDGTKKEIDLDVRTQLESICFINNKTLLLSDEERGDTGGNLYSYRLN